MKKFFLKEVMIAVAVLFSVAVLYWGINYLKGVNLFTPSNFYKVTYTQVNGLQISAPVTINGFQVGLVNNISYDYSDNGKLIVELSLDKKLRLPLGTEALIVTDMLGTSTVALSLGQNTNQFCEVGAEIPGRVQGGLMDNVSKDLIPALAVMLPKVDSILTSMNIVLANPALNESVTRLNAISANLENVTAQLNKTMSGNVPAIMDNANAITADLKTISANLAEMTNELNSLPLDSTMHSLNATMTNVKEITDAVNSNNSSLGLLLNDKRLYEHADQTVLSLDSLFKDIKANPKRYINVKVF